MKNPEILVVIDGEVEIILRNVKTKEESKKIYKKPIMFKIESIHLPRNKSAYRYHYN